MGARRRVVVAVVATVLVVAGPLLGRSVPGATADPAEPVLVVPGAAEDGRVRVHPSAQAADGRGPLTWTLANGGTATVVLRTRLHEVVSRDGRVSVGSPHPELALLTDTVALAPGEVARVRVPVARDVTPDTVALVATGHETDVRVTGLALVGASADVRPQVHASGDGFTVQLAAAGPALVDVAVRATAWPGLLRDEQLLTDVLVPAGGREVPVVLSGVVAGRLTVDVAVSGRRPGHVSASLWWWPREVIVAVAGLLLATTGVLVWRAHRRRTG